MRKSVVVVLPIYQKKFNREETISLKKLREKLSKKYTICVIAPKHNMSFIKSISLLKGYDIKTFDDKFFTYQGYNNLLKSSFFYSTFKEFDYMLIYQTDCLVFESSLDYWMNKNYDYVGSPWFHKTKNGRLDFFGVGNGGLSLRKISSMIEICKKYETFFGKTIVLFKNIFSSILVLSHKIFINRDYPRHHIGCRNEDIFFSYVSRQLNKNFQVASNLDALKFGFEKYPEFCFKKNKNKLPFGCHAWNKYNKKFWKKFI